MNIGKCCASILLLVIGSLSIATQSAGPVMIKLTAKHNGREVSGPDQVTLSFDGRVLQIPVKDGEFRVSAEVPMTKDISFSTVVDGNRIRTTIPGSKFTQETWMILLADHHYERDYASAVPKGAKIRPSCILVFESSTTDPGTVQFDPHCRTRNRQHRSTKPGH
jgi:hypothetical protein